MKSFIKIKILQNKTIFNENFFYPSGMVRIKIDSIFMVGPLVKVRGFASKDDCAKYKGGEGGKPIETEMFMIFVSGIDETIYADGDFYDDVIGTIDDEEPTEDTVLTA